MATNVVKDLTREELRKLARDLMPELISKLEGYLFAAQENFKREDSMPSGSDQSLSREQLKALIRELLLEILWEVESFAPDPDEGLELRPEIEERLRESMGQDQPTTSLEDVKRELSLDE